MILQSNSTSQLPHRHCVFFVLLFVYLRLYSIPSLILSLLLYLFKQVVGRLKIEEQRANIKEQRSNRKYQRAKSKEQIAKSKEQISKRKQQIENIKQQRAKSKEQISKKKYLAAHLLFILITTVLLSRFQCSQKSLQTTREQTRRREGDLQF